MTLFSEFKVICTIDDKTNHGSPINAYFKGELRLNQKEAIASMLQYRNGVLSASTAFGKTVTAIRLIAERQVNTLIMVHTKSLLEQWHQRLEEFLDVEYDDTSHKRGQKRRFSPFGMLGSGVNTIHGIIDIALIQSCYGEDDVKPFVKDYGMVIVDECHHISAVNFERVVKCTNAKYVYGLTATPIRKDGLQPIIFMQCGPIRYDSSKSHLSEVSSFRKILIPRFTPFRSLESGKAGYSEVCAMMVADEYRNKIIVADVARALSEGRTPLILTSRKDHLYTLQNMLLPICSNTITLAGSDSKRDKDEAMKRLRAIHSNDPMILIAIGKYVGEGFDFPRLDTLFLVIPVSWKGVVAQYVGRLHRGYDGKEVVKVYDYIDIHVQMCDIMYKRRLKGYSAEDYEIMSNPLNTVDDNTTGIIHDGLTYLQPLSSDLLSARDSIVISSPKVTVIRPELQLLIQSKSLDGISVTIVAKDYAPTQNIIGANVIINPNLTLQSVIIDKQILWYGNINPIGYNAKASSEIRLKDASISAIFLDTVLRNQ